MQRDQLILIDESTGLFNRRYLRIRLQEEVERSRRMSLPLSLIIVDIDHFKRVNDTYGHLSGDSILKQTALALSRVIRKVDILCRYGGDEFVIILPKTTEKSVKKVAARIQDVFSKTVFWIGSRPINLTVSIGVATLDPANVDAERLFKEADKALYQAKEAGRNRYIHFNDTDASVKLSAAPTWDIFVGREKEIKSILRALHQVETGSRGRMFVIRGGKGIGKTSLAKRVKEEASQRIFLTSFVSIEGIENNSPFGIFLEPLSHYFSDEMVKKVPAIAKLLAFADFKKDNLITSTRRREDLFTLITSYYRSLSNLRPLFIVWDNLELLAPLTWEFLSRFLRQIEELPIFVLSTFDLDFEADQNVKKSLVDFARNHANVDFMDLGPMSKEATKDYIAQALHDMRFSNDLLDLVYKKARGNPLFTREILKTLFNTGGLKFDEKTGWSLINKRLRLPSSIKGILEASLERVNDEERKVLEVASILGDSFPFSQLLSVSRFNEGQLVDILDKLIAEGFLEEDGNVIRFTQPLFIEVLQEKMSSFRKHYLHKKAAEVLEGEFLKGNIEVAKDVSYHYLKAGETEKALDYLEKAAKRAKDEARLEEALYLYEKALRIVKDPLKKNDIDIERAKLLRSVGASKDANCLIKKVLNRENLTDCQRINALYTLAISYEGLGNYDEALQTIDIIDKTWKRNRKKLSYCNKWIDAIKTRAWIYFIRGEYKLAEENLMKGLRFLARTKKVEEKDIKIASFYNILGAINGHLGDYKKAKNFYLKALEIFKKHRKWKDIAVIYNNITAIYSLNGDYIKAIESLENAMEIDEKYGDKLSLAIVFYNLGEIYHTLNILDVAQNYYEKYMELNKEIDNRLGYGYGNLGIGGLKMLRGDFEGAEECLKKAQRIFERLGSKVMATEAKMTLFELAIKRGDLEEATRLENSLEKALKAGASYPWKEYFYLLQGKLHSIQGTLSEFDENRLRIVIDRAKAAPGEIALLGGYTLLIEMLRKRGEIHEARSLLKEGLKLMSRVLRNIPKGFMRERFLEKEEIQSLVAMKKSLEAVKV